MGTWVDSAEGLAQAILELRYNELMNVATDINVLVASEDIKLGEPHEWAALFYEWAEAKVAAAEEEKQRKRAEEEKKKQAVAGVIASHQQKGVQR